MNPKRFAKRFLISPLLAAAALAVIGASTTAAAGGPTVPGASFGSEGVVGPPGLPSSELRYAAITGHRSTTLVEIETDGGEIRADRKIGGGWSLPAVTLHGDAGGLSADGETLVLIRPDYSFRPDRTSFLTLDTGRLRVEDRIKLDGSYSFDAISPDGGLIYLVEYESPANPIDYRVRAYDVAADKLRPGRIVDPKEPEEQMGGQPVARQTSPDGRWAYTLYGGGEETFIHALDTEGATAVCIDLPQFEGLGDYFRLGLSVAPSSGAITVLDRGEPAALVDPESFEVGPVAETQAPPSTADEGTAWPGLAAIAAGLILAAGFVLLRRRRRTRATEASLREALEAGHREPEPAKQGEPVA